MEDTRHSGFTLFELLVTLAVAALLTNLAVPAMGRFIDKARLVSAGEALSQELRQARNHALSHQRTTYFSVFTSSGRWCFGWADDKGCDCRTGAATCRTGKDGLFSTHRRDSEDFPFIRLDTAGSRGPRTVRFSSLRGTASADSFRLHNGAGEVRVIVSPLGRVRACSTSTNRFPPC